MAILKKKLFLRSVVRISILKFPGKIQTSIFFYAKNCGKLYFPSLEWMQSLIKDASTHDVAFSNHDIIIRVQYFYRTFFKIPKSTKKGGTHLSKFLIVTSFNKGWLPI